MFFSREPPLMSNPISYLNVNRETCKTKFIQAISGLTIPSENSATRIAIIFCRIESLIRPLFPYQASNFSISSKSASLDHGTAQVDAHKLCRQTKHQRIPFARICRGTGKFLATRLFTVQLFLQIVQFFFD